MNIQKRKVKQMEEVKIEKRGKGRPKGYRKVDAKRTGIFLRADQEFKIKLKAVAEHEGVQVSDVIRKAIEEYYSKNGYVFDKTELLTKPKIK